MNKDRLWLLVIILIALALRLTLLGEQSLWYDEGVTWLLSQMNKLSDLIEWTAADIQPPLYYLLIWYTDVLFGHSEWALRFPSVVFSTLTIPLIYILASRLFTTSPAQPTSWPTHQPFRHHISLLATILFAISPLMVYYSQEARMYTLLVFEATLTSYLLLNIVSPFDSHRGRVDARTGRYSLALLYAVTAAMALYTHYFAVFLLIAHALFTVLILWQRHWPKSLIKHSLLMFGAAALLFAPWLPTLLARLGDDPSYWPGALKLDEAFRKVLISFAVGETVFEQTGIWLSLIYLGMLILALALWVINPQPEDNSASSHLASSMGRDQVMVFLLLWLLLPIILILILSYQSAKFNARYTMLGWPAFVLILTALLTNLVHLQHRRAPMPNSVNLAGSRVSPRFWWVKIKVLLITPFTARFLFIIILFFILTTSTYSLYNWFTDPRFAKDDFKALAQFVRERIADDETVLLSSGHVFPVWAYYYGWDNWTPLPWMQRLDVNEVTDLGIATDIATAVADKEGVWLVTWQDEVIDPNGIVPFWLDLIGRRPVDAGDFWGVGLEHWRLDDDKMELLNTDPIKRPATNSPSGSGFNFADQIDLLGMTQPNDNEIVLFWRPRQTLPDDLILTLSLTDKDGFAWDREDAVGRPGAYLYPPSRWPVGQIVMTRHPLAWQIGTPPGLYLAEVGLGQSDQPASNNLAIANTATDFIGWDVLDEQGRPQRPTALLEFVNLSDLVRPENGPLPMDDDPVADFSPIIGLRRSILPTKTAQPGDRILLALLWQAGEFNLDDVSVVFDLVDSEDETFRVGSSLTPSRHFNLPRWNPGDVVLGQYWLDIPPETAPGPAMIKLHLLNTGAFTYDEVFSIDQLEVLATERNFTPPTSVDIPLEANFSSQTVLLGVDCSGWTDESCRVAPGEAVNLTLYWRAETSLDNNYTVFTHLLGPNGTVLVNADHAPPKPSQGWVTGEIIADSVSLSLPTDLPTGDYAIEIGLYDAADRTFPRLPLMSGETRVILPKLFKVG